jgi:hypothetical protein
MKKTQLKAISQLAKRLPASVEIQNYYALIKGGKNPIDEIIKKRAELVPINHYNRLKSAYSRNKQQGLIDYINWLDMHNKKMNKIFEELELKQVESSILKIAEKGAKGFWSNLIQFLLSFVHAFAPQKNV